MAEAYAKEMCIELGGHPVIIKVALAIFEIYALMPNDAAESDPECRVVGRSEAELSLAWVRTNQTWRYGTDRYESVPYTLPMPVARAWVERRRQTVG
jgi:hypothetical protein